MHKQRITDFEMTLLPEQDTVSFILAHGEKKQKLVWGLLIHCNAEDCEISLNDDYWKLAGIKFNPIQLNKIKKYIYEDWTRLKTEPVLI